MKFTYLDVVDPTIAFDPVMATNWFDWKGRGYSLFSPDESKPFSVPGYQGKRCIIELEMAKTLSTIQKQLLPKGLSLKVYDAYRPQKTVNFFTEWTTWDDTPLAKQIHYPRAPKKDFHELSYLSRTSSHTLGTAVDVTIVRKDSPPSEMKENFLGVWDPESLDMGNVGYLCFDERSGHAFSDLTDDQKANRKLLHDVMLTHGFKDLDTEFWHYYFEPERNKDVFFDFDVCDNYATSSDFSLILPDK